METHWKKLVDNNYIGAHDLLPGQELKITIESIGHEMVKTKEGEEKCVVAKIKGAKKGMVLNRTNCKIITDLLGSPYIEHWVGKSVIIYAVKIKAFGEQMEALRIKREKI